MSVRRAGQRVFDWAKLSSMVPEEARVEFAAFRQRHEACRTRFVEVQGVHHLECEMTTTFCSLAAYSEKPETIDWDFYKRSISLPGFVDSFRKQFEALKVLPPKDTTSAAIEEQKKNFVSVVTETSTQ